MNRRNFFTNLLGAACLALAERVVPAALVKAAAPALESQIAKEWTTQYWNNYDLVYCARFSSKPNAILREMLRKVYP